MTGRSGPGRRRALAAAGGAIAAGIAASLAALVSFGTSAGCTRANPAYCDGEHPCAAGEVCQRERHACVAADECEAGGCLCAGPADCPSTRASCRDELCLPCASGAAGDADCAASDPARPVCFDGVCVECLSDDACAAAFGDAAPHCDVARGECAGCAADDECGAGVCDEAAARCLTAAELLHVARDGVDGGGCTAAAPCATIAGALEVVVPGRTTVVVAGSAEAYRETLALDGWDLAVARVAIVGAVGSRPSFVGDPDRPALTAGGGGAAFTIERLELRDGNQVGVACTVGATLALHDVVVRGFEGVGVLATACTIEVAASWIEGNEGGGIGLIGALGFRLVNDVVVGNGEDDGSVRGGLSIEESSGVLEFCTVADNRVGAGPRAAGIDCVGELEFRNNIVWGNRAFGGGGGPLDVGGDCRHAYAIVGGPIDPGLDGGAVSGADPAFDGARAYHLTAGSPAIDAADPAATEPRDVDGDGRPAGAGRDLGADERAP